MFAISLPGDIGLCWQPRRLPMPRCGGHQVHDPRR
jgi:hypothetical protein